ncbi:hypothetical protein E4K10_48120 [Streptomyces sp. T1317-0309]|nr:hypothetical protein E4K10_48120 [Streptomyces sp. T1317-0309]
MGDVRNPRLLRALTTAVHVGRAQDTRDVPALRRQVEHALMTEKELLVDPDFFHALARRESDLAGVDLRVKRGAHHNELTRYRYDVALHKRGGNLLPIADVPGWTGRSSAPSPPLRTGSPPRHRPHCGSPRSPTPVCCGRWRSPRRSGAVTPSTTTRGTAPARPTTSKRSTTSAAGWLLGGCRLVRHSRRRRRHLRTRGPDGHRGARRRPPAHPHGQCHHPAVGMDVRSAQGLGREHPAVDSA